MCACDPKSYRQCSHKRSLDINEHEKATDHLRLYYSDQLVKEKQSFLYVQQTSELRQQMHNPDGRDYQHGLVVNQGQKEPLDVLSSRTIFFQNNAPSASNN